MAFWTTGEIRTLKKFYGNVPQKEMYAMLPRHSPGSIMITAHHNGLTRVRKLKSSGSPSGKYCRYWPQIAHKHFAKRELEMRDAG